MDTEHWRKLQPLMDEALALSIDDRGPWLQRIRRESPTIAEELEALLDREGTLDRRGFLDGPLTQGRELVAALKDVPADRLARLTSALADRYVIGERVGRGGMAEVFSAHDVRHGRRVAIKVIRPDTSSALGTERFLSEIRLTAALTHPNILPLLDSGEVEGVLYYVMPFIDGESLRVRMRREGALSVADVLRILRSVAEALAHAHERGTVHRDIKPDNILLADRQAWLADFGIAKAMSSAVTPHQTATGLGVALGSPGYMAPEQIEGADAVDARADLYSLGVVAWEMLAGRALFEGATLQQLFLQHVAVDAPRIETVRRDTPIALGEIIAQLLAKSPAERLPSASNLLGALDALGSATGAQPALRRPWTARRLVGAALLPAGVAGAIWLMSQRGEPVPAAPQRLSSSGDVLQASLSPDGRRYVFTRRTNPTAVWIRDVADSGDGRILAPSVVPGPLTWVDDSTVAVALRDSLRLLHASTGLLTRPSWGQGLRLVNAGTGALYSQEGTPVGPGRHRLRHVEATGLTDSVSLALDSGEAMMRLLRHPVRLDFLAITRRADSSFRVQRVSVDGRQTLLRSIAAGDSAGLHKALGSPTAMTIVAPTRNFLFVRVGADSLARVDLGRPNGRVRRIAVPEGALSPPTRDGRVLLRSVENSVRTWRFPLSDDMTKSGKVVDEVGGAVTRTALSPDGTLIAQVERLAGSPETIVVRNMETGVARRVLTVDRAVAVMHWSPDGNKIALRTALPGQSQRLEVLDVRDGRVITLGRASIKSASSGWDIGFPPAWSTDSKTLYAQDFAHVHANEQQFTGVIPDAIVRRYALVDGDTGVAIHDYLVSRYRKLPKGALDTLWINGLTVSPDGRDIVVGGTALTIIPLGGGTPRRVVEADTTVTWMRPLTWRPDGRIVYATRSADVGIVGGVFRTFSVAAAGGVPQPSGAIPPSCVGFGMLENRLEASCYETERRSDLYLLRLMK